MKLFLAFTGALLSVNIGFSQNLLLNEAEQWPSFAETNVSRECVIPSRFNRRYKWQSTGLYTIGLSSGPETLFAVKGTIQGRHAFSRELRNWYGEFTAVGIHGGAELSLFGLFAVWGSAGINAGFSAGPVTFDGSLTFWFIGLNEEHYGTTTYNPKIGLQLVDLVWLKVGTSIFLRGENGFPDWMKLGNSNTNVELSYVIPI